MNLYTWGEYFNIKKKGMKQMKVMRKLAILMVLVLVVSIVPSWVAVGDTDQTQFAVNFSHTGWWSGDGWGSQGWTVTATTSSAVGVFPTGTLVTAGDPVTVTFAWNNINWNNPNMDGIWWDGLNWRDRWNNIVSNPSWNSSWWGGGWNQMPFWRVVHTIGGAHYQSSMHRQMTFTFTMPSHDVTVNPILDGSWNSGGWFDQWGIWHPGTFWGSGGGSTDWWFTGQGGGGGGSAQGGTTFIGGRPAGTPAPITDAPPAGAVDTPPAAPVVSVLPHPTLATAGVPSLRLTMGSTAFSHWGVTLNNEAAPFIDTDDRAMVPLRIIAEALDAYVRWDGGARTVFIERGGLEIGLPIDVPLPDGMGTPVIVNSRTFVPLRYVSEIFGARVRWDEAAGSVYVYRDGVGF